MKNVSALGIAVLITAAACRGSAKTGNTGDTNAAGSAVVGTNIAEIDAALAQADAMDSQTETAQNGTSGEDPSENAR